MSLPEPSKVRKKPVPPFDWPRVHGTEMVTKPFLPLVLSLSKHENQFFRSLLE